MAKVFYIECAGQVWRDVAQECLARAGWEPVLWTGEAADEHPVCERFPGAVFLCGTDAALNLAKPRWPVAGIDAAEFQALASAEATAIRMMDRMDADGSFDPAARRAHFRDLACVWAGALEHYRPERVVFSIAPHIVFDYVLYALCRRRGVPTLMFERHGLPGWVFTLDAFDEPSRALERALARPAAPLPAPYAAWLRGLRAGAESARPANFQKKLELYGLDSEADRGALWRGIAFEAKRALVFLARDGLAGPRRSYLRSRRPGGGRARWLETVGARFSGLARKRRLEAELRGLTSAPVSGERYVLLALHYQPERSTVPMGGIFGDQLLVADLLARTLPDGWRLYVKEHPWQLQPFGRGELQRPAGYYEKLAAHSNVRLMPLQSETSMLIDGASAVATVSGSAGWQAMCRGVPALVFGEAWYRACEGAFRVRNDADARAALAAVAAGYRTSGEAVERFTAALASICVPGVLEPGVESVEGVDAKEAARSMALALVEHVEP